METFGGINPEELARADFYTSHEGLHLGYEETVTRYDSPGGRYYNGGAEELRDEDLEKNYTTYCDPRLNYAQSLEMAFLLSKLMRRE